MRIAERVSQVKPISQASGSVRTYLEWPAGHSQRSMFQKRVEPITWPVSTLIVANGIAVPTSFHDNAVSTYWQVSILFCGTGLQR